MSFQADPGQGARASSWFQRAATQPRALGGPPTAGPEIPDHDRIRPGANIAEFTLLNFVARGGMGQVWEAWDNRLERSVALKLVTPDLIDARRLEFIAREARAGGRIVHPNIVATHSYGNDHGIAWIAQEFVPGGWTLKHFLDEARATEVLPPGYYAKAAELVATLAEALATAHAAGVIHRDVKPQNVLIAPDDRPKLADFGLARVTLDPLLSVTGEAGGTWAYMSPEQVLAMRQAVDHRTDVFSLGVVLYELLALRRPFDGDTSHQLALDILYGEPMPPTRLRSQCPTELALIAAKAMEKEARRRYQSAQEFADDLRRHLSNQPIEARPPGPWSRAVKWTRRHPAVATGLGVATIAVAGLSALLLVNVRANLEIAEANRLLSERTELAQSMAQRASEQSELAEERTRDVLRLSDGQNLVELLEESATLWPPRPERLPALRRWVVSAQALVESLPVHRARRDELRA